jgi:hypothetical protein
MELTARGGTGTTLLTKHVGRARLVPGLWADAQPDFCDENILPLPIVNEVTIAILP